MIADEVIALAKNLQQELQVIFADQPRYQLDFSWPSVGVLDNLTFNLRGKEKLSDQEYALLNGVASYLAGMAHDSWILFSDSQTITLDLVRFENERPQVIITVKGGEYLPSKEQFSVNVTRALETILRSPQIPFPHFEQATRPLHPEENVISPFALGLLSGLTPYGEGRWKELTMNDFQENIIKVVEHLSVSSAKHYATIYPNEEFGASPELYAAGVIFPPLYYNEPLPALRGVNGFFDFCNDSERKVSPAALRKLAKNLALSPDESCAAVGAAVIAACGDEEPFLENLLIVRAQSKLERLRGATVVARDFLGKIPDWIELIGQDKLDQALPIFSLERELGLIPFFRVPLQSLYHQEFYPLIRALAWSNLDEAEILSAGLYSEAVTPYMFSYLLQGAYISFFKRNYEQVLNRLDLLSNYLQSATAYERALFFEIVGLVKFSLGEVEEAGKLFERSIAIGSAGMCQYAAEGMVQCLIRLEKSDIAFPMILKFLQDLPYSYNLKLLKISLLYSMDKKEAGNEELQKILSYGPMRREVFQLALTRSVFSSGVIKPPVLRN
jgi:hypothetical protein